MRARHALRKINDYFFSDPLGTEWIRQRRPDGPGLSLRLVVDPLDQERLTDADGVQPGDGTERPAVT